MDQPQPMLADAFKLSVEDGNVVIEFGHGAGLGPAGQPNVAVTERIVLPAAIAQRLMLQLDDALKPHAAGLLTAQARALPPGQAAVAARPGPAPTRPPADESGTHAAQLIRLVGELGVPHQYERSFRIARASLQANRFLLTFNTRDVIGDPSERVLAICDRMGMPAPARQAAEAAFGMADCLHLGFEGDAASIVCKLYLERSVPAQEARTAREANQSVLLHLAFKWDLLRGESVTTRYRWFPGLSAAAIEDRFASIYGTAAEPSRAIATAMLREAASRVDIEQMQYLEVEEAENDRHSFDLNLYNAHLRVGDVQPLLYRMRDHFGVRPGQFQALYDQVKGLALGHLAGGVHRNGAEFFNLYYGVVALPHFSDRFAAGGTQAGS
jgi:tryptophan halogenase